MSQLIQEIEKEQLQSDVPELAIGDLVQISKTITEGKKERIQKFEGTIVKMQGSSSRKTITLRKIIDGVGVEKTYLLHSPLNKKIQVMKSSKVRRSKLYYLRGRIGAKANRLKSAD